MNQTPGLVEKSLSKRQSAQQPPSLQRHFPLFRIFVCLHFPLRREALSERRSLLTPTNAEEWSGFLRSESSQTSSFSSLTSMSSRATLFNRSNYINLVSTRLINNKLSSKATVSRNLQLASTSSYTRNFHSSNMTSIQNLNLSTAHFNPPVEGHPPTGSVPDEILPEGVKKPLLFHPIKAHPYSTDNLQLKNRVVVSPMCEWDHETWGFVRASCCTRAETLYSLGVRNKSWIRKKVQTCSDTYFLLFPDTGQYSVVDGFPTPYHIAHLGK